MIFLFLLIGAIEARGLGDRALAECDYAGAARHYQEAEGRLEAAADPGLRADLAYKREHVRRLLRLQRLELTAWGVALSILSYFVLQMRRPLRVPLELLYALPIYALFLVAAVGRDPQVLRAMLLIAAGSLLLLTAAGLSRARGLAQGALLVIGNLSIFFAASNRAGLI